MIKIPIAVGSEKRHEETIEIVEAFLDPYNVDTVENGKRLAEYLLNNATAKFCESFVEAWQNWFADQCGDYEEALDFKFCKKNMLCDCCKRRFECWTTRDKKEGNAR